jgi:hypothetical protein
MRDDLSGYIQRLDGSFAGLHVLTEADLDRGTARAIAAAGVAGLSGPRLGDTLGRPDRDPAIFVSLQAAARVAARYGDPDPVWTARLHAVHEAAHVADGVPHLARASAGLLLGLEVGKLTAQEDAAHGPAFVRLALGLAVRAHNIFGDFFAPARLVGPYVVDAEAAWRTYREQILATAREPLATLAALPLPAPPRGAVLPMLPRQRSDDDGDEWRAHCYAESRRRARHLEAARDSLAAAYACCEDDADGHGRAMADKLLRHQVESMREAEASRRRQEEQQQRQQDEPARRRVITFTTPAGFTSPWCSGLPAGSF